jgi:hypothetical protein
MRSSWSKERALKVFSKERNLRALFPCEKSLWETRSETRAKRKGIGTPAGGGQFLVRLSIHHCRSFPSLFHLWQLKECLSFQAGLIEEKNP